MLRKIQQYRDAIAACFLLEHSTLSMKQIVSRINHQLPNNDFSWNTFTAQVHKACANVASAYKSDAPKILFYSASGHTYRSATSQEVDEGVQRFGLDRSSVDLTNEEDTEAEFEAESTFAQEADLQRYLVRNLQSLEKGLTLWDSDRPIEYTIDRREIDILARDSDGVPVVIELKMKRGLYYVLGQALLYRGLVKRELRVSRVRIIIVASEISDELKLASAEVGDIHLWKYTLSMQVEKVSEGL